jgi:Carbohydrate esterase, sialic acid-specific acetylesterase
MKTLLKIKATITILALCGIVGCGQGASGDGTQHIISYGQSLSLGVRSVVSYPNNPTLPNDYQDVGLMFADGVRSLGGQPLVPFKESLKDGDYNTWVMDKPGETPLYGALLQLKGLAGTRIGSAAGRGGMPIADLSKGTTPYARLLNQVTTAKAQAESPYTVPAIIWMQGEADPFNEGYAGQFSQLVSDLDRDVRAITGQAKPVQIHVCLTSYAVPAAAQQAVAAQNPNVHIDCDTATLRRSDGVHLSAAGSRDAGMALGASILQTIR